MSSDRQRIRIRYEQHDIHPFSGRLFLNDIDISHGVRGFKITMDPKELTQFDVSIAPDDIEIDAQTVATLTAIVESREDKS